MAAFRQLLHRGLLAGRRVDMDPTRVHRAFSTTTTTTGGSPVPQGKGPSLERVLEEYRRVEERCIYVPTAVTVVLVVGVPVAILGLRPFGPSKPVMRDGES